MHVRVAPQIFAAFRERPFAVKHRRGVRPEPVIEAGCMPQKVAFLANHEIKTAVSRETACRLLPKN